MGVGTSSNPRTLMYNLFLLPISLVQVVDEPISLKKKSKSISPVGVAPLVIGGATKKDKRMIKLNVKEMKE